MNLAFDAQVRGRTIVLLAAAVLLLAGTTAWRVVRPAAKLVADAPLDELRRETERLRIHDDQSARQATATLTEMRERLWTVERLEEWKRTLPERWTIQEAQPRANASTITRRFVLTRRGATARDWTEIHSVLKGIDTLPTSVVQRLKLAMPEPRSRQFEEIEVILDLWFRKQPAGEIAGGTPTS